METVSDELLGLQRRPAAPGAVLRAHARARRPADRGPRARRRARDGRVPDATSRRWRPRGSPRPTCASCAIRGPATSASCGCRGASVRTCSSRAPRTATTPIERTRGRLLFGDGVHGAIPPAGSDDVRARSYRSGGGRPAATCRPGAIDQVLAGVLVAGVRNPRAAEGGAEREPDAAVRDRGPPDRALPPPGDRRRRLRGAGARGVAGGGARARRAWWPRGRGDRRRSCRAAPSRGQRPRSACGARWRRSCARACRRRSARPWPSSPPPTRRSGSRLDRPGARGRRRRRGCAPRPRRSRRSCTPSPAGPTAWAGPSVVTSTPPTSPRFSSGRPASTHVVALTLLVDGARRGTPSRCRAIASCAPARSS